MGAIKTDLHAKERTLDSKYRALDNPAGVRILLSDYNALVNRQYQGDYGACLILIDLQTAIDKAELTRRQADVLRLVYVEDLTQSEAGKRLGIAQQSVGDALDRAVDAIAEIYYYWSGHNEGYGGNGL